MVDVLGEAKVTGVVVADTVTGARRATMGLSSPLSRSLPRTSAPGHMVTSLTL